MHKKPSLVVFDFDDTLYSYQEANEFGNNSLISYGAFVTGTSIKDFSEILQVSRKKVKFRLGETGSSHSRLLYIHETLATLGFADQASLDLTLEQEFWRNYFLAMKLREGAEDLLSSLRFNNIPIALVTDLTLQIQLRKLTYLKLESFFDVVVASEEVSKDKSSLKPFDLLIDRCQPEWLENVWFIGDRLQDAPVQDLVESKKIVSGYGWIRGNYEIQGISTWESFKEIELNLEKSLNSANE